MIVRDTVPDFGNSIIDPIDNADRHIVLAPVFGGFGEFLQHCEQLRRSGNKPGIGFIFVGIFAQLRSQRLGLSRLLTLRAADRVRLTVYPTVAAVDAVGNW